MFYEFECKEHGRFTIQQPMDAEHKAECPKCGGSAQRIYFPLKHFWVDGCFRPDGSKRQDDDYACLRG